MAIEREFDIEGNEESFGANNDLDPSIDISDYDDCPPFTRRRIPLPYSIRMLDRVIRKQDISTHQRKVQIEQAMAHIRYKNLQNPSNGLTKRLAILYRRYPELVSPDKDKLRMNSAELTSASLSLGGLVGIDYQNPFTLKSPLCMGLFKNNARALKVIIDELLKGANTYEISFQFGNKGKKYEPFQWDRYTQHAISYLELLDPYQKVNYARFYHDFNNREPDRFDGYDDYYVLDRKILLPIARASAQAHTILEIGLIPAYQIDGYYVDLMRENHELVPEYVFKGAKVHVEWQGRILANKDISGIINKSVN